MNPCSTINILALERQLLVSEKVLLSNRLQTLPIGCGGGAQAFWPMGRLRWFHRPFKLPFVVSGICQFALGSCNDAAQHVNTSFGKVLYKQRHELNKSLVCSYCQKYNCACVRVCVCARACAFALLKSYTVVMI